MAATVWIVRVSQPSAKSLVNGITSCVINKDDTTVNEAQAIAAAEAAAQAAGIALPAGYFDSAAQWNAVGQLDADGDAVFFDQREEAIS